jgi:hypothetical protein
MKYVKRPKYNTGGQLGATIGSTATSFIPGVGPMLAPIGGMVGGFIGKELYKEKQPEMPKNIAYSNMGYKYGGKVKPIGKGAKKYVGPKHEDGGILIDENGNPANTNQAIAEVEGGETEQNGYIFSDTLIVPETDMTFADVHEMLVAEGAPQEQIDELAAMQEQMNGGSTETTMQDGGKLDKEKYLQFKEILKESRQAYGKNDTKKLAELGLSELYNSSHLARDFSKAQELRKKADLGIVEEASILLPHVGQQVRGTLNRWFKTNYGDGGNLPKYVTGGPSTVKGLSALRGAVNRNTLNRIYSQPNVTPTPTTTTSIASKFFSGAKKAFNRYALPFIIGRTAGQMIGNSIMDNQATSSSAVREALKNNAALLAEQPSTQTIVNQPVAQPIAQNVENVPQRTTTPSMRRTVTEKPVFKYSGNEVNLNDRQRANVSQLKNIRLNNGGNIPGSVSMLERNPNLLKKQNVDMTPVNMGGNAIAPNWGNMATGVQAATRLGAALFTPKPKPLPTVSYNRLSTTSPVFEGARRSAGAGFRTAMGVNPQAAYAQYLDATSNIAGQEADYRSQREAMNEQMRQETQMRNIDIMGRNQQARDADTAARIGLVSQAVDIPVTKMARDEAMKQQLESDLMFSSDRFSDPIERERILAERRRRLGLRNGGLLKRYKKMK